MQIVRYVDLSGSGQGARVGIRGDSDGLFELPGRSLGELLELSLEELKEEVTAAAGANPVSGPVRMLPPVDGLTEVWASGVTYRRSSQARQEESQAADVYARVYDAVRPEIFFKSQAWRVCGDGEPIGIRPDSEVNVPEAELALVCNTAGEIVGVTACNDVSSRSIEGENPLYLPQAKLYAGACAVGPAITPVWAIENLMELCVEIVVLRGGEDVWSGTTSTARIHRSFEDIVEHLFRCASFPQGVVLSTGTGLVPDLSFTLRPADEVRIDVAAVGSLRNPVRSATGAAFAWLTPDPARAPA